MDNINYHWEDGQRVRIHVILDMNWGHLGKVRELWRTRWRVGLPMVNIWKLRRMTGSQASVLTHWTKLAL